jgi:cysteine-rich repeat protein
VHAVHDPAQTPYIGATDDANDTDLVFDWVTDEPWGAASFAPGEPDDGPAGDGECLIVTGASSAWADASCTIVGAATGRICELERAACGDGIVQSARGEQCDDGGFTPGDGCDPTCQTETLYFSEYVEGTSNNKVLEVANPRTAPFDLAANACALKLFVNGSVTATNTLALTGTIAGGDVFVACNTSVGATISPQCDLFNGGVMGFNGDDAITLECNGTVLDSIGQTGFDPGTEWGTGLTSTADNTLRRACGITHGDPLSTDTFDPAATFRGLATDTFDGIGVATCAP